MFLLLKEHTIINIRILQNMKKDRISLFLNLSFSFRILIVLMFQIITILIVIISRIQNFSNLYQAVIYLT